MEDTTHNHPDEIKYVKVAAVLAVITAAEVSIVYVAKFHGFLREALVTMMLVKFTMVAGYFMHLKFDSKIFRRFFILGIVLAIAIFSVALWTFTFAHRLTGSA